MAIRDSAQAHADGAEEEDQELPKKVAKLRTAIFPAGVQAVTKATFVEQLAAVEGILATLKNKEYAATIQDLGLGRLVKQLGKLSGQFREALEAPEPPRVSFGDVRAARAQGQENLLQAVAMILGKHPTPSSTDLTARGALLGPILKQNEAVRLYLRSRRAIHDVNPETGEVGRTRSHGRAATRVKRRPARRMHVAHGPRGIPVRTKAPSGTKKISPPNRENGVNFAHATPQRLQAHPARSPTQSARGARPIPGGDRGAC
ncbi:MAG: hypothetical protein IPK82_29310 [Polyangiaceae bacterium]|nr:hypothetical protein [Polyangiaceae bacterium]